MSESQSLIINVGTFLTADWATEICSLDGGLHDIGIVKNCEFFPPEHPEFLHCDSCGTLRCVKCGDIAIDNGQINLPPASLLIV